MQCVHHPASKRGRTGLGWLDSRHSFSFGTFRDPARMGFRSLRVLNDDVVAPGHGFDPHHHTNAEILSYVLEGRLEHADSIGNGSLIEAGSIQSMSAGSGVTHSEFNPSSDERVHFLQIWILPDASGGEPRYAEKRLASETQANRLNLLFAGRPRDGALAIRADADVYLGRLDAGRQIVHATRPERGLWIQVVRGSVEVDHTTLEAGDGASIEATTELALESRAGGEFLLFDLR